MPAVFAATVDGRAVLRDNNNFSTRVQTEMSLSIGSLDKSVRASKNRPTSRSESIKQLAFYQCPALYRSQQRHNFTEMSCGNMLPPCCGALNA